MLHSHKEKLHLHQQHRYIAMILPLTSQFDINRQVESQTQVCEDGDGEDCVHDVLEDAEPLEGGAETAERKKGKTSSKKGERARKSAGDTIFGDGAPLHALTRRAVPIWTCGPFAVEVAEPVNHDASLKGAKHALEAWNIHGLRNKASELMKGDFLHANLYGVAQNCDKVKTRA